MGQLSEGIYEKVRTVGLDAELGRLAPGVSPEFTAGGHPFTQPAKAAMNREFDPKTEQVHERVV